MIIPVHNGERYVRDAIDSVLGQTYRPIECIVVDDGSTDGTPEIVATFGTKVDYIRQENLGVAHARNRGADVARGDVLAFLDADDLWLPAKAEKQMALLEESGVALVYSGLHVVDEQLNFIGRVDPPSEDQAFMNTLLMERPVLTLATALIRAEVVRDVGGFDVRLSTSADSDLACRIAADHQIRVVDTPLFLYRQHRWGMHHDPRATEHDRLIMFENIFSGPRQLPSRFETRARSNLYVSLAGRYISSKGLGATRSDFMRYVLKALLRPDRVLAGLWRLSRPGGLQGRLGA